MDGMMVELDMLGAAQIVVSTNVRTRQDGLPYANDKPPTDTGVAVYFQLKGKPMVFACDRFTTVGDNMQAIRLTVAAIRGIERWGASDMMERAFSGFQALPQPRQRRPWRDVFGYSERSTPSREELKTRRDELALKHHPDRGGDRGTMSDINVAYDEAERELAGAI